MNKNEQLCYELQLNAVKMSSCGEIIATGEKKSNDNSISSGAQGHIPHLYSKENRVSSLLL